MAKKEMKLPKIEYVQPLPDKETSEQMLTDMCKFLGLKRTRLQKESEEQPKEAI